MGVMLNDDMTHLMDALKKLEKETGVTSTLGGAIPNSEPKVGLRYNKGKVDLTQLSPLSQILESLVFMYGECKYLRNNWKSFKKTEEEAVLEFLQCAKRHIMRYEQGEFLDPESGMPHTIHAVWNLNRINDVYYYGMTHMKDGKDLYHQPCRVPLPEVPRKADK